MDPDWVGENDGALKSLDPISKSRAHALNKGAVISCNQLGVTSRAVSQLIVSSPWISAHAISREVRVFVRFRTDPTHENSVAIIGMEQPLQPTVHNLHSCSSAQSIGNQRRASRIGSNCACNSGIRLSAKV